MQDFEIKGTKAILRKIRMQFYLQKRMYMINFRCEIKIQKPFFASKEGSKHIFVANEKLRYRKQFLLQNEDTKAILGKVMQKQFLSQNKRTKAICR
jgi:hypothetical protein